MKERGISPLIEKYSEVYQKDPRSRVFAPLAEGYRQAGLIDKAMEILKNGIRHNPTYVQGYITLASCYSDMEEFQLTYTTLRPLVGDHRDNIRIQKLFARSCLETGQKEEALETYKYLLFLNPRDEESIKQVEDLEKSEETYQSTRIIQQDQAFDINEINVSPSDGKASLDEWIKVDLKNNHSEEKTNEELSIKVDDWKVEASENVISMKSIEELDDKEIGKEPINSSEPKEEQEAPVITHSLVDLYLSQGHITKAKELLGKILELNPEDRSSIEKLKEVEQIEASARVEVEEEDEGHQRLLDSLDKKLGPAETGSNHTATEQLQSFLDAIRNHSEVRKNSQI